MRSSINDFCWIELKVFTTRLLPCYDFLNSDVAAFLTGKKSLKKPNGNTPLIGMCEQSRISRIKPPIVWCYHDTTIAPQKNSGCNSNDLIMTWMNKYACREAVAVSNRTFTHLIPELHLRKLFEERESFQDQVRFLATSSHAAYLEMSHKRETNNHPAGLSFFWKCASSVGENAQGSTASEAKKLARWEPKSWPGRSRKRHRLSYGGPSEWVFLSFSHPCSQKLSRSSSSLTLLRYIFLLRGCKQTNQRAEVQTGEIRTGSCHPGTKRTAITFPLLFDFFNSH